MSLPGARIVQHWGARCVFSPPRSCDGWHGHDARGQGEHDVRPYHGSPQCDAPPLSRDVPPLSDGVRPPGDGVPLMDDWLPCVPPLEVAIHTRFSAPPLLIRLKREVINQ